MNKILLVGRLTKDPELKYTPGNGTAVIDNCSIAVDRDGLKDANGKKITDFLPLVIWNKSAENTANYCKKGDLVDIEGRVQTRSYDAKDGTKRYVTEVNVSRIEFLQSKPQGQTQGNQQNYNQNNNSQNNQQNNSNNQYNSNNFGDYSDITPIDDGDIPF